MNTTSFLVLIILLIAKSKSDDLLSTTENPGNHSNTGDSEDSEFEKMFDSLLSKYKRYLYPDQAIDRPTIPQMNITSTLLSLVELDYVEERLSTVIEFLVQWNDQRLKWNDTGYEMFVVPIDAKLVWKPTMKIGNRHVGNRARADDEENVVYILSTGHILWDFVKIIDTRCNVDTTYFPFDKQFCHIDLKFPYKARAVLNFTHTIHNDAKENGNWRLSDHTILHQLPRGFYELVTIEYEFDRKPANAVITLIIPVFILVTLLPLVFILPKDSGDRLGLTVTVLLAVSVYMTLVADKLPSSSDPLPMITIILFIWYISNALILLLILVNAKIYRMNNLRPVPSVLRRFVKFTRRIFCQGKIPRGKETDAEEDVKLTDSQEVHVAPSGNQKTNRITWKHVSSALDIWDFIIIYAMKIIFAITVFCVLYNGDNDKKSELGDNHKD